MYKKLIAPLAALALASCSQKQTTDDHQTVVQDPSFAVGSIVGRVTSSRTGLPLAGIAVSTVQPSGTVSTATDANGAYALNGLSAGALYEVRFGATGYVSRFDYARIPDQFGSSGGNVYPRGNGVVELDMQMSQGDATVEGIVIQKDAQPAPGAIVAVDLSASGYDFIAQATAGANGAYSITGLPGEPTGLPIKIVSYPYSSTGDAVPEYGSVTVNASTYPGTTTRANVDLRIGALGLMLVYSDVDSGVHTLTPSLSFTFNNTLNLTGTSASLTDTTVWQTMPTLLSLDATGAVLTVRTVGAAPLVDQHNYQVSITAMGANGKQTGIVKSFLASGSAFTVPAPVTNLAITSPVNVDYNTTRLGLSWSASTGAASYNVYARDNNRNPGYVLVGTTTTSTATTVTLPSFFDSLAGDGVQTPFGSGTIVTLVVVPIDAYGASGDFLIQSSITVADTTPPTVRSVSPSSSVDNSLSATPKPVTLTIWFSEQMNKTVVPTVTLPFTSTTTPIWTWGLNGTTATYDVTIPGSTNGSGQITISGGTDTSNHALTTYTGQIAVINVIANGGFETGTLSSWTTAGLATVSTSPYSGASAAQLGSSTPAVLTSSISQTFTVPTGASTLSFFYKNVCLDTVWFDWATATLRDNVTAIGTPVLDPVCSNTGTWQQASVSVASMVGHSVTLTIQNRDDGAIGDPTYTLVDEIMLQ